MTDITSVLDYHLFSIGNQPITPVQLIVLAIAFIVTAILARGVKRLFEERLLRHMAEAQRYTLARLTHHAIWLLGIVVGLRMVNIDLTALTIVFGALGLGVGLGLQSIVADFVAGLVLLFERPIKVHDRVTSEAIEGNVVAINFRATTIVTNDNITMIVPNSEFVNRRVINWSHEDPKIRIHVPIGVAYGSDTRLVTDTLLALAKADVAVLNEPAPAVHFVEFGDSSLNFELLVWIDNAAEHFRLRSRLNYAIDEALRTHGIQIPFPQRDLHVRTVPPALLRQD